MAAVPDGVKTARCRWLGGVQSTRNVKRAPGPVLGALKRSGTAVCPAEQALRPRGRRAGVSAKPGDVAMTKRQRKSESAGTNHSDSALSLAAASGKIVRDEDAGPDLRSLCCRRLG